MLELVDNLKKHLEQNAGTDLFEDKLVFKKNISKVFNELQEKSKLNSGTKTNYWQMIRLVLTGDVKGPPVFEIFNLLQKKNIIYRLEIASATLEQKKKATQLRK
jgi:hypothetical protein